MTLGVLVLGARHRAVDFVSFRVEREGGFAPTVETPRSPNGQTVRGTALPINRQVVD